MAIKIDIEKAYDRLRWDFIENTLKDGHIPWNIINVIRHCISSTSMQILWNDGFTDEFTLIRGLR